MVRYGKVGGDGTAKKKCSRYSFHLRLFVQNVCLLLLLLLLLCGEQLGSPLFPMVKEGREKREREEEEEEEEEMEGFQGKKWERREKRKEGV